MNLPSRKTAREPQPRFQPGRKQLVEVTVYDKTGKPNVISREVIPWNEIPPRPARVQRRPRKAARRDALLRLALLKRLKP